MPDTLFVLMCLAAVAASVGILQARAKAYAADDAELLAEASAIIRTFAFCAGGLMLLWALGVAFGLTKISLPPRLTVFDRCLMAIEALLLARATWWIYLQDGAEVLARHHQLFRVFTRWESGVKIVWALALTAIVWAALFAPDR
jgi:SNF family Na+-dependent transporter